MERSFRRFHRFIAVLFMVAVVGNFVALACGYREPWVGFVALVPLVLLMISGAYLFVRPYLSRGPSAAAPTLEARQT